MQLQQSTPYFSRTPTQFAIRAATGTERFCRLGKRPLLLTERAAWLAAGLLVGFKLLVAVALLATHENSEIPEDTSTSAVGRAP